MAKSRNQKGKILVIEHLLQGTGREPDSDDAGNP